MGSSSDTEDDERGERTPLTASSAAIPTSPTTSIRSSTRLNRRSRRNRSSSWCNGQTFVSFTILVLLAAATTYFHRRLLSLQEQLAQDRKDITALDAVLQSQAEIIERFNSSVTNEDVLKRMDGLRAELTSTETKLNDKMDEQYAKVNKELQATMDELNQAVSTAEMEIHNEVEVVKGDVQDYVRTTQDQFSMENSFMIYQLAGTFTLLECLISMWHMTAHLRKFNEPFVQRKILAILWMCPIYGVTSWLSLVFVPMGDYLRIIKDLYEAYVIYMFFSFLIAVLGKGNREAVVQLLIKHASHLKPPIRNICPCYNPKYSTDRKKAEAVLMQCQVFAMQFVLFKPVTSIVKLVLDKTHCCDDMGDFDYRSPHFYILLVENVSIFLAFAGLLNFYHAVQTDLAWCRPFPKFLCIKGVVFMTFWQGLVIAILANYSGQLNSHKAAGPADQQPSESSKWGEQAQNFLICLEMLLFSIAHFYVFPTDEWQDGYRVKETNAKFGDNMALRDFVQDLKLVLSSGSTTTGKSDASVLTADTSLASDVAINIDEKETITAIIKKYDSIEKGVPLVEESNEEERSVLFRDDPTEDKGDVVQVVRERETAVDVNELRRALAFALLSPDSDETANLLKRAMDRKCEGGDAEEEGKKSAVSFAAASSPLQTENGHRAQPDETTGLLSAPPFVKRQSSNTLPQGTAIFPIQSTPCDPDVAEEQAEEGTAGADIGSPLHAPPNAAPPAEPSPTLDDSSEIADVGAPSSELLMETDLPVEDGVVTENTQSSNSTQWPSDRPSETLLRPSIFTTLGTMDGGKKD